MSTPAERSFAVTCHLDRERHCRFGTGEQGGVPFV